MNTLRNKIMVAGVTGLSVLAMAGMAGADVLTDENGAIDTVQAQLVGYAAPIAAALVAVGLAFVGVRLIPRVIRWIGSRI